MYDIPPVVANSTRTNRCGSIIRPASTPHRALPCLSPAKTHQQNFEKKINFSVWVARQLIKFAVPPHRFIIFPQNSAFFHRPNQQTTGKFEYSAANWRGSNATRFKTSDEFHSNEGIISSLIELNWTSFDRS
jgi:hypothetical protein